MFTMKQTRILFWIVLIGYAIFKYAAAAPPGIVLPYIASVALLVLITAVIPFVIARAIGRSIPGHLTRTLGTVLVGIVASVAGYAAFWFLFIQPNAPDVAMFDVARRGIGWGAAFGALAAFWNNARTD